MRQDFCEDASHSNRPHKSSLASQNPEPPPSRPDFRLSYAEGNVPTGHDKMCTSIQHQHPTVEEFLGQSSDCDGNGEQTSQCRQSQSIQTKSGVMQGIHSLPVCMHDHRSECRECQMQSERQLRDPNEQLYVEAAKCNPPMVHTAKVHSAKVHSSCSQRLVNPINHKLIECCDRQNARRGNCQDHQRVDYFYSNLPNGD
ncbi:MAG: hypothetical protein GY820_42155, partial [Gammaproteobacteria bacterium]|nr:hypothetical protein [Gammaproteobacteria bacterium]